MKIAILAGGFGERFVGVERRVPKPLASIGGRPILWHIMKHYEAFGWNDFVVAIGHRGDEIRSYFANLASDGEVRMNGNSNSGHSTNGSYATQNWKVKLVETGEATLTGSRIKQLEPHLGNDTFMLTWCDGLSNVNLDQLLRFHRSHGKLATVTAVRPPSQFGKLTIAGNRVTTFQEKPAQQEGWINGAYFVLEPGIFRYIHGSNVAWEGAPMESLAQDGQLMAFRHPDFWQCMDTVSEQRRLEAYWQSGKPPWKTWS